MFMGTGNENEHDMIDREMTNSGVSNTIEEIDGEDERIDGHADIVGDVDDSNSIDQTDFGEIKEASGEAGATDAVLIDDDGFEPLEEEDESKGKKKDKKAKKKPKAKEKSRNGSGSKGKLIGVILGIGIFLGIAVFVGGLVLDVYNEMRAGSTNASIPAPPNAKKPLGETSINPLSETDEGALSGEKRPPHVKGIGKRELTEEEKKAREEYKKTFYSDLDVIQEEPPTPIEKEVMGLPTKKEISSENGGVCHLSIEYKSGKEYVYYVKEGGKYVPLFNTESWDGKGIVLDRKIVIISSDIKNGMVQVENGKYLPSDMFSECTEF